MLLTDGARGMSNFYLSEKYHLFQPNRGQVSGQSPRKYSEICDFFLNSPAMQYGQRLQ
jgi:hypothetical protein